MGHRTVTGTIYRFDGTAWANAPIEIRLKSDPAARTGELFPKRVHKLTADENGAIAPNPRLETPETGAWLYELRIGRNDPLSFYLEGNGAISIDQIVTLAGQTGSAAGTPQAEWLLAVYAGFLGAAQGEGLVVDNGDPVWAPSAADVEGLTTANGDPGEFVRVAAAPGGLEYRTAAQVRGDIDAEVAGSADAVQSNLTTHVGATGAGVHGAGATGAAVLATATPPAALAVLETVTAASITGTYTVNGDSGTVFHLTITGAVTISFSNVTGSRVLTVHLIQDAVGSHAVTFSGVKWPDGTAPTLTTAANSRDKLVFDAAPGGLVDGQLVGADFK